MSSPLITVVICTYNRADVLPKCLEAISKQTLSDGSYEVIIVDNNSSDSTADVARDVCATHSNFKYLFEPKQGLARARNSGMRAASSPIAAFTDDDAFVAFDWLERILARFTDLSKEIVAVGGEIDPQFEGVRPSWLDDDLLRPLSARLGWSTDAGLLGPSQWLCEANSAYRISPVLALGGFPEHLGRIGMNLLSGENAINTLLELKGYKFFFDPDIRVRHFIPGDRLTKTWFRRRMFWQGVTTYLVQNYLRDHGVNQDNWHSIEIPFGETGWERLFDNVDDTGFNHSLGILCNLGYILASQGAILGR